MYITITLYINRFVYYYYTTNFAQQILCRGISTCIYVSQYGKGNEKLHINFRKHLVNADRIAEIHKNNTHIHYMQHIEN